MTISIVSSQRDLFVDMVVYKRVFENNFITLLTYFTFIP